MGISMAIKIALADDSDLTLIGIQSILDRHDAFQVVGTRLVFSEFLELIAATAPDVILLSDRLEPDIHVLTLIRTIQETTPQARLLILGHLTNGLVIHELLNCGVMGYLYRHDRLEDCLVEAIHTVKRGKPYLSPSASTAYLLAANVDNTGWQLDAEARDVLRLMANGYRPQEIAQLRNASVRRVYSVCERLRRRFGADTNVQLIALAAEQGFLP